MSNWLPVFVTEAELDTFCEWIAIVSVISYHAEEARRLGLGRKKGSLQSLPLSQALFLSWSYRFC